MKNSPVLFANGEPAIMADSGGGYHVGQVLFANASRFLDAYYSEPLTNYAVGWRDPNDIEATLNFIAPPVPVGRRFEWKAATNAEEFLSEVLDDERAIGADFKRVEYVSTDVTDKTFNKGLTYIVDLDNVNEQLPNWQNNYVGKLLRRLYRNELRRGLTAINAAATNTNVTWSTGSTNNPDQDVLTALLNGTSQSGIRGNRAIYGDTAWNNRSIAYGNNSGTGAAFANAAAFTPEQVRLKLMVDKLIVSRERYQTSSSAKSEILGSAVFTFFAEDGVDTEDPSNIKRFVTAFNPEQGGGLVRVFVQQISSKLVAITVEHYSKIIVTYSGGIRKLTVS